MIHGVANETDDMNTDKDAKRLFNDYLAVVILWSQRAVLRAGDAWLMTILEAGIMNPPDYRKKILEDINLYQDNWAIADPVMRENIRHYLGMPTRAKHRTIDSPWMEADPETI